MNRSTALAKLSSPLPSRHDISRTSGLALPKSNTPLEHCDIIVTAVDDRGTAKSFATSGNATLLAVSPSTPASRVIVWQFFWEGDLHGLTGRQPTSLPLEPDRDRAGERRFARDAEHVIGDVDMEGVPAVTQLEAEPRQLVRQQVG